MELKEETKELLLKTKEYIINNNFEMAYDYATANTEYGFETGLYTEALLQAGVNPLKYTSFVPWDYMNQVSMPSYTVKLGENIKIVHCEAFMNCDLDKIIMPHKVIVDTHSFFNGKFTIVCNEQLKEYIQKKCLGLDNIEFEVV